MNPQHPQGKTLQVPTRCVWASGCSSVYAVFYAGFVAINLISPLTMSTIVFAGLNLATVYGFALIIGALIEALIYDALCRRKEAEFARAEKQQSDKAQSEKGGA